MVIGTILGIIVFIIFMKLVFDIYYISVSKNKLTVDKKEHYSLDRKINILILIPVLREQSVIEATLNHFEGLLMENINLMISIAGTNRELVGKAEGYISTGNVVNRWITNIANRSKENSHQVEYCYCEVSETVGDRATQLNNAVREAVKKFNPDIVGVYDADSLPDAVTLTEVAGKYLKNPNTVFQQPVHFIDAANRMAKEKKNPVLVANALYQTTWTVIRELPRWTRHHEFAKKHKTKIFGRNDYLIGHGEFIPYTIYQQYNFPEFEVTDGIQLGYRLSMSGVDICPLNVFCRDDVPQQILQLIGQHKRWFGGCNRLMQSSVWCRKNTGKTSLKQVVDGYWSQLSWAYAAVISFIGIVLSIVSLSQGNIMLPVLEIIFLLMYCYAVPYVAHRILPDPLRVRWIDWLCLPVAIGIKGIGPNLYFIQKAYTGLTRRNMKYFKVER